MLQHKHVLVSAKVTRPPIIEAVVEKWLLKLVDSLGMKVMMGPFSGYSPIIGNRGLTAGVIIETSHIMLHCWDEEDPAMLQLDVYTCSDLDLDIVWSALEIFDPIDISFKLLDRESGLVTILENNS